MARLDAARSPLVAVLFAALLVVLWALRSVLMLVGFAALLAFALDPLVSGLQHLSRGRVSRGVAAGLVVLALVALGAWAAVIGVPRVVHELGRFVERAPLSLDQALAAARAYAEHQGLEAWLGPLGGASPMHASELLATAGRTLLGQVGKVLGSLGALVGIALVPMLAFYQLAEREAVEASVLRFVPEALWPRAQTLIAAVDRALRSYVRGQGVVCLTMGVLVGVALALWGFPVAALLGVIVALAEVVPILGFWLASLAIALAGYSVEPGLALWGFVTYLGLNQLVGLLVTPRVMGRHMKLHPFLVIVSILAGGTLLGPAGAVLALPITAALQSVVAELTASRGRAIPEEDA